MCDPIREDLDLSTLPLSFLNDILAQYSTSPGMGKYGDGLETFEQYWLQNNTFQKNIMYISIGALACSSAAIIIFLIY